MLRATHWVGRVLLFAWMIWIAAVGPVSAQDPAAGRIGGQVLNGETGRPLPETEILVVEAEIRVLTDVQGRYRTRPLAPGRYTLEVSNLGFQTVRIEGVAVASGETSIQNVALVWQALEVEGIVVEAERGSRTSSEAGLLSMQKAAASVTDGISAEQMRRSPDSDASDAIIRVTGVSVVDNQFVVVRGLSERYSNTLLNGAELASPEPTRRVVPLDLFPASLLESVVTTKTATPDRPGDFAGGSVEIRTKEFPEEAVREFKVSGSFNSLATFKQVGYLPQRGTDYLGLDGQNRDLGFPVATEQWAESLRSIWVPSSRTVLPDFGIGVTLGDQLGSFERAFGYVISLDYGLSTDHDPNRFVNFLSVNPQSRETVELFRATNTSARTGADWGVLANFSYRLGGGHNLSWRNLITREAEDLVNIRQSFDPEPDDASYTGREDTYQVRYIQRKFWQSQLGGSHLLPFLGATLDWKGSYTLAAREEPENRVLKYEQPIGSSEFELPPGPQSFWYRMMDEWSAGGQIDLSMPVSIRSDSDALFKVGALYRMKRRELDASKVDFYRSGEGPWTLPPDDLFTPEIITGPNSQRLFSIDAAGPGSLPYTAADNVAAAYLMADLSIIPRLRLVGGLRMEKWDMEVETAGQKPTRDELDALWSANLTIELSERMNLRGAAYRTLSRPDPRELALTVYVPLAGECSILGNPELVDAKVLHFDGRWEWYPAPGQLLAASVFRKQFTNPFFELARTSQGAGGCQYIPQNAESSNLTGIELEFRRDLGFLSESLESFWASANLTLVGGEILSPPPDTVSGGFSGLASNDPLPLQDQSDFLLNASLGYFNEDGGFTGNVLLNYFSDRIDRFGPATFVVEDGVPVFSRGADFIEVGRTTLDGKISQRLGESLSVSLSGKNLTNARREVVVRTTEGLKPAEIVQQGVSLSLSFTYRF